MTGFCGCFGEFFEMPLLPNYSLHLCTLQHSVQSSILIKYSKNRATEMDITMIGLQNAGKTSLLRVLAVSAFQTTPTYISTILTLLNRVESSL